MKLQVRVVSSAHWSKSTRQKATYRLRSSLFLRIIITCLNIAFISPMDRFGRKFHLHIAMGPPRSTIRSTIDRSPAIAAVASVATCVAFAEYFAPRTQFCTAVAILEGIYLSNLSAIDRLVSFRQVAPKSATAACADRRVGIRRKRCSRARRDTAPALNMVHYVRVCGPTAFESTSG